MTDAVWFCIQTNPNCERKAVSELRRAGIRVYLPKQVIERQHRRTKAKIVKHRPLFVGYLFIRFPAQMYDRRGVPPFGLARQCQGVREFLRCMNELDEWVPFPVPERAIATIMRRQRGKQFDAKAIRNAEEAERMSRYKVGGIARVMAGPFESFMATIEKMHSDNSVEAEVELFGQSVRVRFDDPAKMLEPVEKAA
jgi:transcription antitermination factor NusG